MRVVVAGRVQGVGFRWFVRQEARRLGLAGWVRNREDGTVELAAAGESALVRRLVEHVRVGPESATVDSVRDEGAEVPDSLPYPFVILR